MKIILNLALAALSMAVMMALGLSGAELSIAIFFCMAMNIGGYFEVRLRGERMRTHATKDAGALGP